MKQKVKDVMTGILIIAMLMPCFCMESGALEGWQAVGITAGIALVITTINYKEAFRRY